MKQKLAWVLFWVMDRRGLRQDLCELLAWMVIGWLLFGAFILFGLICRRVLDLVDK